ncbi:MAG TPA: PEP-CTERM sorting domain-containing protein [Verrucomicrobiae bacterium]|nr:PEP-CTERM sorting domain-containing protein [Verrucomicrobiae bacterium]
MHNLRTLKHFRCSLPALFLAGALGVLALAVTSQAFATGYSVQIPSNEYGNLNQHDMPVLPTMSCGPASVANALLYLQNAAPNTYDSKLVPSAGYGGLISLADTLAGPGYMNTDSVNGTWHDNLIMATKNYIESEVPGQTSYSAQDHWSWSHQTHPAWAQSVTPTWQFIYQALTLRDAVDILLTYNSGGGHFVTVNGFSWNDSNGNNIVDSGENAEIYFMNPWTGAEASNHIWQTSLNGAIETDYSSSWISSAFTISVPEPSAFALLFVGAVGFSVCARGRRR